MANSIHRANWCGECIQIHMKHRLLIGCLTCFSNKKSWTLMAVALTLTLVPTKSNSIGRSREEGCGKHYLENSGDDTDGEDDAENIW